MNNFDYIRKAMQCSLNMTQHLGELTKDQDPLMAEYARILLRDAYALKKEAFSTGEVMNDGTVEGITPIVSRYANTPFESAMYAKASAEKMAEALAPIRCARSEAVSKIANHLYVGAQTIMGRIDKAMAAIAIKEAAPELALTNRQDLSTSRMSF